MAATQWQEVGGQHFHGRRDPAGASKSGGKNPTMGVYRGIRALAGVMADNKGEGASRKLSSVRGQKQVQEIAVWLQCFAVFVGVVARFEPEVVPGLMAYMVNIIRASQESEGAAWVAYDAAYRRQAAATGVKKWGGVNSSLYTICFTGKARKSVRCDHCLSAGHKTGECVVLGEEEGDVSGRVKAVESAVLALPQAGASRVAAGQICVGFTTSGAAPSEIVNTGMHASGVEVLTLDLTAMLQPDGKQGQVLFTRTTGWGPHLAHIKGLGGGGGGGGNEL